MNDALLTVLIFAVMVTIIVSIIVIGAQYSEDEFDKFVSTRSCDELYIEWSGEMYSNRRAYIHDNCMNDIFPGEYPTDVELYEYFVNQSCVDLGVHIIKKHFEYDVALDIYNVKCGTPLESINLPEIIIDKNIEKKPVTDSYGSQYDQWK